jgi:hypothetical protein
MLRLLMSLAAVLVLAAAPVAVAQDGWRTYAYDELDLAIDLPGHPVLTHEQNAGSDIAVISVEMGDTYSLMVRVMDRRLAGAPDEVLDTAMRGAIKAVDGRVVSLDTHDFGGWPAREVLYDVPGDDAVILHKLILVDGRLHQLIMVYGLDAPQPEGARRFMDSLTLGAVNDI